jgi:pimeloyl-[acyl-carrier protein] synthase
MTAIDRAVFKCLRVTTGMADRLVTGSWMGGPSFLEDPYSDYARLRARGELVRSFSIGGWNVVGFEAVRDAMRDARFGVDLRKSPFVDRTVRLVSRGKPFRILEDPTMLNVDPPDHTRLRRLARQGFLHKYVCSLAPKIEGLVDECLATVQGGAFDLMETLAQPLPANVIADILGVPREDRSRFQAWSELIAKNGRNIEYDALRRTDAVFNELIDYLAQITDAKRADPGDDLISHLIAAEEDGDRLSAAEIHATSALLLIAGHETTTRLIGNAMWLLLSHPEQLEMLRANPDLMPNAIEEVLRFEPPVQHMTRIALEDMDFHGVQIRKHQLCEVYLGSANRDPEANPNPDVFDISRDKIQHVGFGYGIHLCLGAELARLEARIALTMLLERFPSLGLTSATPAWGDSTFVRGLDELVLAA